MKYSLYKYDNLDNQRVWTIEWTYDAYRTHTGIVGGAIITSEWTRIQPKNIGRSNETSNAQQTRLEVDAKIAKKKKEGYSSDQTDKKAESSAYIKPMLAKNWNDYKDKITPAQWQDGLVVQCKFNGVRCICTSFDKPTCYSRTGEKYLTVPHINTALHSFFTLYPEAVLDGELYNFDLRQKLNELMKLVRKTVNISSSDLAESARIVQYHIYDGYLSHKDANLSYLDRYIRLQDALKPFLSTCIRLVESHITHNINELLTQYVKYLDDDQEGMIIRLLRYPYEHKRSRSLLKFKPLDTAEFTIVDIQEGVGNWSGTGKIITFQDKKTGKRFNGTFKGTHEDCVQFLKNRNYWIGKIVTVEYNGFSGLGTPNYARLNYSNCITMTKYEN